MQIDMESDINVVLDRLRKMVTAAPLDLSKSQKRTAEMAARLVTLVVQAATPQVTGGLAASTTSQVSFVGDTAVIQVAQTETVYWRAQGIDYPLARLLIDGTDPHPIVPYQKKALWWRGANHPVHAVQHPGTEPNPYAHDAMMQAIGDIQGIIQTENQIMMTGFGEMLYGNTA